MAIKCNDIVILEYSERLSEFFLVDLVDTWDSALLRLLVEVVEKVSVLKPLGVNFGSELFL